MIKCNVSILYYYFICEIKLTVYDIIKARVNFKLLNLKQYIQL